MKTIILDATDKYISTVLAGAKTSIDPDFYVSYSRSKFGIFSDYGFNYETNYGSLNGTAPVTLVPCPGSGYAMVIKSIIIHNSDSAAITFTLRYHHASDIRTICKVTLQPGDTFSTAGSVYNEGRAQKTTLDESFAAIHHIHNGIGADDQVHHGDLSGLDDVDDHPQYIWHGEAQAEHDIMLGAPSPFGAFQRHSWADFLALLPAPGGGGSPDGWIEDENAWSYADFNGPIFYLAYAGDAAALFTAGARVKLVQNSIPLYFIVVNVGVYDSENDFTIISLYGGTDYSLDPQQTITAAYYSHCKAPAGFPLDPLKWSQVFTSSSNLSQSTPEPSTWYNVGSVSLDIPDGLWRVKFIAHADLSRQSLEDLNIFASLSTSDDAQGVPELTGYKNQYATSSLSEVFKYETILSIESTTTYYLVPMTESEDNSALAVIGYYTPIKIIAECAYL